VIITQVTTQPQVVVLHKAVFRRNDGRTPQAGHHHRSYARTREDSQGGVTARCEIPIRLT
jgi:hypothetical protein